MRLRLGYSPCPNDTFIFHALQAGLLRETPAQAGGPGEEPIELEVELMDIDALNQAAMAGELDVAKVSYHAYGYLAADWVLLRSGGALGRGVGPLVVARDPHVDVTHGVVAVPGGTTTAKLLLALWRDGLRTEVERYDRIMPGVAEGLYDAGLIIHESRFTYPRYGLHALCDLGAWWEGTTGRLVPLGAIAVKRSLGPRVVARLEALVRASLEHAFAHPEDSSDYVAEHAQEMEEDVRRQHIELYVNEYSLDVGPEGEAAARELLERGAARGLFAPLPRDVFAPGAASLAGTAGEG
jgi:1,4-dihydroxy-6-naphthoate synthase